jgi:hypothetical protein
MEFETWARNRSERKKTETAEMPFLRLISGYKIRGHVRNTTIHNALQIYALGERIQDYKRKWHNHILLVRMDSSRLTEIYE